MATDSFNLLTTTRFDRYLCSLRWNNEPGDTNSPYLLLPYHYDRLVAAANQHGWEIVKHRFKFEGFKATIAKVVEDFLDGNDSALRIRITLSISGTLNVYPTSIPSLIIDPLSASLFNPLIHDVSSHIPVLSIYIDKRPISTSIFTTTKTTNRTVYDEARSRNGISLPTEQTGKSSDVLLYNLQALVMETTIFNVAFWRNLKWITPPLSTGCLPGVLRRRLLEQERIQEDFDNKLTKDNVKVDEWVLLFNGVQGCRLGMIK